MRIVQNRKAAEKHYRRIKEYAPKTGVVRMLRLTEKQYDNITMIVNSTWPQGGLKRGEPQ